MRRIVMRVHSTAIAMNMHRAGTARLYYISKRGYWLAIIGK